MNTRKVPTLALTTLAVLAFVVTVSAQSVSEASPGFYRPFTLAPAEAPADAGGGAEESQEALAKAAQNPVA